MYCHIMHFSIFKLILNIKFTPATFDNPYDTFAFHICIVEAGLRSKYSKSQAGNDCDEIEEIYDNTEANVEIDDVFPSKFL